MARSRVVAASGLAFAVVAGGAGVTWAATNNGHDAAAVPITPMAAPASPSPSASASASASAGVGGGDSAARPAPVAPVAPVTPLELFGPDGLPAGPVKLLRGQTLVVHLSEQAGSTGYSWSATVRGGSLVKDGDAVSGPATSSKPMGGVPMVGAPGDHAFTFRAQGSGAARLVFTLKRPFQGEPAKTVSLSVIVVAPSPAPHPNPAPNPNPGPHSNPAPSPNPGPGPAPHSNPAPNADPGPGPSLPHGMAPDPAGLTVEVDGPEKLPTTPVALKAGQKLVVHLREPGSSGFSWSTSVPANLTLLDMDLVAGVGTPGTPGQHNFTFLAARSGDGKIEFVLRHPWVGGETAQRVELAVTVR